MATVDPPVEKIFSSPYFRCLQTVQPFVEILGHAAGQDAAAKPAVLGETGIAEWYGAAPFEHPTSAPPEELNRLFPAYDISYVPAVAPSRMGENIAQLHERVALTLDAVIRRCDEMGVRAVLLCSHAATIIAIGRVLTGNMPENVETEDFRAFTCGLSVFRRRATKTVGAPDVTGGSAIPAIAPSRGSWKNGIGAGGGWTCELNSDCSFLSGGEERGWQVDLLFRWSQLLTALGVFLATKHLLATNGMRPSKMLEWSSAWLSRGKRKAQNYKASDV